MSLEDLRDNYKSSAQLSDLRLKLNGATYRTPAHQLYCQKYGNTLRVKKYGKFSELEDVNSAYALNTDLNIEFSLDKKKRWQMVNTLVDNMYTYNKQNMDVRLYETRARGQEKRNENCIAVHKSKGDQIRVQKTYANVDSIKRSQEKVKSQSSLFTIERNKQLKIAKKMQRCSKPKIDAYTGPYNEIITIDDTSDNDQDDEPTNYIQYDVQYAPKTDILKHQTKKYASKNNFSKQSHSKHHIAMYDYDSYESDHQSDDEYNDQIDVKRSPSNQMQINLDDLIDKHIVNKVEKTSLKEFKKQTRSEMESDDRKDKKMIVEKSEIPKATRQKSVESRQLRCAKPIGSKLALKSHTLQSEHLKSLYGVKYNEAQYSWPRNFNINLDDEVKSALIRKHSTSKDFDLVAWLRFEEIERDGDFQITTDSNSVSFYNVSILSNLNCTTLGLENVNPCDVHSIELVVEKAMALLVSMPLEFFHLKDFSKPWVRKTNLIDELPITGGEKVVKTVDEVKLEFLNKASEPSTTTNEKFLRLNSIDVIKYEDPIDVQKELEITQRLEDIFKYKKCECILCFDQILSLNNCVVLKNCAHCICKECMRAFVDSQLANSLITAGKLQCPGCEGDLEFPLMINYASDANQVEIFLRRTIERVEFVLNNYKWCPWPYCGRILRIDLQSNPYGTVSCTCGFKMCLKCNNQPHFPAKCSQIANYYSELKENNDFADPEDSKCESVGKRCPLCNTFIEKNGGCNHMYCITCKKYFCWNCLMDWNEHTSQNVKCKPITYGEVKVEFLKVRKFKKPSTRVPYENSLLFRQRRQPSYRRELIEQAKRLLNTVKFTSDSGVDLDSRKLNIKQSFEFSEELERKKNEINSFLRQILGLLNDLYFICEHAHVLVCDATVPKESLTRIKNLTWSIQTNIWLIEMCLKDGYGMKAIEDLKKYQEKSMRNVKLLKNIKVD